MNVLIANAAAAGSSYPQCGSVSFIQRFGDALNLNPHFHSLVLDGVYDLDDPQAGGTSCCHRRARMSS